MSLLARNSLVSQLKNFFWKPAQSDPTHKPELELEQNTNTTNTYMEEGIEEQKRIYEEKVQYIVQQRKEHLNPMMAISYADHPLKIIKAKGQYLYEYNGTRILDCINNVSHIGHCQPYYVMQMIRQSQRLLTNSRFLYDELMSATQKLLKKMPKELCVVTFVNSGSYANDIALQMAQIHTNKSGMMCLYGAYHGITRSCTYVSPYKWSENYKQPSHVVVAPSPCTYRGFLHNVVDPSTYYAEHLYKLIKYDCGAFISEYMQSCGGQIVPPKDFFQKLYHLLRRKGVVCIGDEVQTGFGRLGYHFWAFEYYGVVPDILTVGKAMGNGFPVAAVICTRYIAESYKHRDMYFFSTFGGNPMAVTATCAVMDVIEWLKLPEKAQEIGRHLNRRLKEEILEFACVGDIRGMGFFQGIDIVTDKTSKKYDGTTAKRIIMALRYKNILVSRDGVHGNVLKIKPPMVFNHQNVDTLVDALKEVLKSL